MKKIWGNANRLPQSARKSSWPVDQDERISIKPRFFLDSHMDPIKQASKRAERTPPRVTADRQYRSSGDCIDTGIAQFSCAIRSGRQNYWFFFVLNFNRSWSALFSVHIYSFSTCHTTRPVIPVQESQIFFDFSFVSLTKWSEQLSIFLTAVFSEDHVWKFL